MAQEEKSLLLKDLNSRLSYGLKVKCGNTVKKEICELIGINAEISTASIKDRWAKYYLENVVSIKPYLRPMSSMTDEEKKEYQLLCDYYMDNKERKHYFNNIATIDWYHQKYFDCRGLIKLGLALEAPEGMYK